jgi:hypothetical protein
MSGTGAERVPRHLALLLLALLISPGRGDSPTPSLDRIEPSHDFAALSPRQARRLAGKRATFRVALDSRQDTEGGRSSYDCESADSTTRTLRFAAEEEVAETMVVEATLLVVHQPRSVAPGGVVLEGFTEYRLLAARRCD